MKLNWVSPNDRLPKDDGLVMVRLKDATPDELGSVTSPVEAYFSSRKGIFTSEDGAFGFDVRYWAKMEEAGIGGITMNTIDLKSKLYRLESDAKACERQCEEALRADAPFAVGDMLQRIGEKKPMRVATIIFKRHWQTREPYLEAIAFPLKLDGAASQRGERKFNLLQDTWYAWENLTRKGA